MKAPQVHRDHVVWKGDGGGPRVLIRDRGSYASIVIDDGRGHYVSVSPGFAAQIATGLDLAVERIGRDGRLVRKVG